MAALQDPVTPPGTVLMSPPSGSTLPPGTVPMSPPAGDQSISPANPNIPTMKALPSSSPGMPSVGDEAVQNAQKNTAWHQIVLNHPELFQAMKTGDPMAIGKTLLGVGMPILQNIGRRIFDPTGALGKGSILNVDQNRPMANDPSVGSYIDALMGAAFMPQAEIPEAAGAAEEAATQAPKAANLTYKQARQALKDVPFQRSAATLQTAEQRAALAAQKVSEIQDAIQTSAQDLESQTGPLTAEQQHLQLARRTTQEQLAQRQAQASVQNIQQAQALAAQKAEAEAQADYAYNVQTGELQKSAGSTPTTDVMSQSSKDAVEAAKKTAQAQIRKTHEDIVAVSNRPANITSETKDVIKGYEPMSGEAITEPQTTTTAGKIDASPIKAALDKDYDRLSGEIQAAVSQGSPGARALMQLHDGPDTYSLEQMLDIKAALNEIGYGAGDGAFTDANGAIARGVAAKVRSAIRGQVAKFSDGGDEALGLMDKEKALLQGREARFGTQAARSTSANIERYGQATKLLGDPVGTRAWMGQVDGPTIQGAKSQIVHHLLGDGPDEFAKNWSKLSDEEKGLWFTRDEVNKGNAIAQGYPNTLRQIASTYKAKQEAQTLLAAQNSAAVRTQQSQLSQIQTNIDELNRKIASATTENQTGLLAMRQAAQQKYLDGIAQLRRTTADQRNAITRQMQVAQVRLDRLNAYRKIGWMAAGGVAAGAGLQGGGTLYRALHDALFGGGP